ncbi:MAG: hypothetical protein DDT21_02215 [Syntrophomonadaceae bacterium]|nr:hypothetical protein [Bacillota bacterium]
MRGLRKILHSLRASSGGFTLLELVVVLAIMGFLVAMIAPRLAGVVAGAQRNADDTNISRLLQATSQFQERTGRLPAEMTNLVVETGTDEYQAPNVSNNDPGDGKEAFSADLGAVLPLHIHLLSEAEANELIRLGITEVRNFNPSTAVDPLYNGIPALAPTLERVPVDADTPVLMVGAGHDVGGWVNSLGVAQNILHPSFAYRIVLGFGQDSELVTEGQLQGAAISPQGTQTDNYLFNNYLLVLPRLQATIDRGPDVLEVTASNAAGQEETFDLTERQRNFELTVLSPEGRTVPPATVWTIQ